MDKPKPKPKILRKKEETPEPPKSKPKILRKKEVVEAPKETLEPPKREDYLPTIPLTHPPKEKVKESTVRPVSALAPETAIKTAEQPKMIPKYYMAGGGTSDLTPGQQMSLRMALGGGGYRGGGKYGRRY